MKAMLIVDMPNWNGCRNCQFNIGGDLCTARDYEDGEDGCPLKPMDDYVLCRKKQEVVERFQNGKMIVKEVYEPIGETE